MPVVQTIQPQENDAHNVGQGFAHTGETREQTSHETEVPLTREQALVELLTIHNEEEARRQRYLIRHRFAILTVVPLSLLVGGISSYFYSFSPKTISKETAGVLNMTAFFLMAAGNTLAQWYLTGWRRYTPLPNSLCSLISDVKEEDFTPLFSSQTQQNIISGLLNYPDEPRIADALCRALMYYRKDRNLLYVRLARLLPLLPSDGVALSETARQALLNIKGRTVEYTAGIGKEQTLPVLQSAAKAYFARTGEPAPRPRRKWFKRRQAARQTTKESG